MLGRIVIPLVLFLLAGQAQSNPELLAKSFQDKEGCFLFVDLETREKVVQHNQARCSKRFNPMSTFKVPLAAMAFDTGYFDSLEQKIPWDGVKRSRSVLNQDQTPVTFLDASVLWVSRQIVGELGQAKVQHYLNRFVYGNRKFEGRLDSAWITGGSIEISAVEQLDFMARFWGNRIGLSRDAARMTKAALMDEAFDGWRVFGKTGTGCIDAGCMSKPGRQLGWYVGVAESAGGTFAFALNFSDRTPQVGYAGLRAKKIVLDYLRSRGSVL